MKKKRKGEGGRGVDGRFSSLRQLTNIFVSIGKNRQVVGRDVGKTILNDAEGLVDFATNVRVFECR